MMCRVQQMSRGHSINEVTCICSWSLFNPCTNIYDHPAEYIQFYLLLLKAPEFLRAEYYFFTIFHLMWSVFQVGLENWSKVSKLVLACVLVLQQQWSTCSQVDEYLVLFWNLGNFHIKVLVECNFIFDICVTPQFSCPSSHLWKPHSELWVHFAVA